jgi:hypothetical protein
LQDSEVRTQPDDSEEHIASFFRIEKQAKFTLPSSSAGFLLGSLLQPEDGGDMFHKKVGFSPNYTPLHPRKPYYSVTAMRTSNP